VPVDEVLAELAEAKTSSAAEETLWKPIAPSAHSTYSGAKLVPQADGSYLARGDHQPNDVYTIRFRTESVTAIKLELIPDERLPNGGPGRDPSGDCDLGELALEVASDDSPWHTSQLPFSRCAGEGESVGLTAERCIDGNLHTGWRVLAGPAIRHSAVFVLEQPLTLPHGQHLKLQLRHGGISGAAIGRFRVQVTAQPFLSELKLPLLSLPD